MTNARVSRTSVTRLESDSLLWLCPLRNPRQTFAPGFPVAFPGNTLVALMFTPAYCHQLRFYVLADYFKKLLDITKSITLPQAGAFKRLSQIFIKIAEFSEVPLHLLSLKVASNFMHSTEFQRPALSVGNTYW